jgi:hypothetical protein
VESVTGSVHTAGGLIVKKKFEQNSTNQLSLVLSAFNDVSHRSSDLFALQKASSLLVHLQKPPIP